MERSARASGKLTVPLEQLEKADKGRVGGKSANLGELSKIGVPVLPGFSTTSRAFDRFMKSEDLESRIREILNGTDTSDIKELGKKSHEIREAIRTADMPEDLREDIRESYRELAERTEMEEPEVAVRSSATAEDLPDASFAGQQDTFLNVSGASEVIEAVKKCFASLFTDRAISYREEHDFPHFDVKLSCAVQKMADPSEGASGVMFTMDPDSGFEKVVRIEAAYGLGEPVVGGDVNPDHYTFFKQTEGIIEKELGEKERKMISSEDGNRMVEVPEEKRQQYVLDDEDIERLGRYAKRIEDHYGNPMDIEWVLDGELDELFIVQARPETVHSNRDEDVVRSYSLEEGSEVLVEGAGIGDMIGSGSVRRLDSPDEMEEFSEGEVLVTERTDPDWEPVMKKASGIVTDRGGKTSHAAIVSRELGVPAVVGTGDGTSELETGDEVTVDCSSENGRVLDGELEYSVSEEQVDEIPETDTDVMLIMGSPSSAFYAADLPVNGVGLAREEFIISSQVGEHPLSLIEKGEEDRFVEELRSGISKIAAAFYPDDVIVRLSDFKSDEYRGLEGGEKYESEESNPMLGWRGASRYYDERFEEAFRLECEALRQVREEAGLDNIVLMVPFVRTPEEGEKVKEMMDQHGLDTGEFEVYVMTELPSNVMLADELGEMFDGFSIGSNDLTQLTLGVDRNAGDLAHLFDEDHRAVKRAIRHLIRQADMTDTKIGICGDAPSTIDGYAEFLVEEGIDSISVSPDVALETKMRVAEAEDRRELK
ncbi:MAG: phosphoenolpyruvate synthase [Candidatus Nanohaloarchaea archaeon]